MLVLKGHIIGTENKKGITDNATMPYMFLPAHLIGKPLQMIFVGSWSNNEKNLVRKVHDVHFEILPEVAHYLLTNNIVFQELDAATSVGPVPIREHLQETTVTKASLEAYLGSSGLKAVNNAYGSNHIPTALETDSLITEENDSPMEPPLHTEVQVTHSIFPEPPLPADQATIATYKAKIMCRTL